MLKVVGTSSFITMKKKLSLALQNMQHIYVHINSHWVQITIIIQSGPAEKPYFSCLNVIQSKIGGHKVIALVSVAT